MTLEEFEAGIQSAESDLVEQYTKKFGMAPPDMDNLEFLGSKIDRLRSAIESNAVIQDIIIPDGADI